MSRMLPHHDHPLRKELRAIIEDIKDVQGLGRKLYPELRDLYQDYKSGRLTKDAYKARCKEAEFAVRRFLSLQRRSDLICSDVPTLQAFQRLGADPPTGAPLNEDDLLAARAALRGETAPVTAAAPAAAGAPAPSADPAGAAPSAQPPSDGARCAVRSRCTPLPDPAAPPTRSPGPTLPPPPPPPVPPPV